MNLRLTKRNFLKVQAPFLRASLFAGFWDLWHQLYLSTFTTHHRAGKSRIALQVVYITGHFRLFEANRSSLLVAQILLYFCLPSCSPSQGTRTMAPNNFVRPPTAEEWEKWKPEFVRLYRGMDTPLPKVMEELSNRGFVAR